MQTKIITETVLKVKEGTGHFFRGKVIVTLNDGGGKIELQRNHWLLH